VLAVGLPEGRDLGAVVKRQLEIDSYQTAWAMLGRSRSVWYARAVSACRATWRSTRGYFGGDEPGLAGGRARGKRALVGIAVERLEPRALAAAA